MRFIPSFVSSCHTQFSQQQFLRLFRMSYCSKIYKYGDHEEQFYRLSYAEEFKGGERRLPVVVIFHGGFWKEKYGLDNAAIETLCPYFVNQGYVVCEVEYRRREHIGGGFPGTNVDCVEALVMLSGHSREGLNFCDMDKTVYIGHSAGAYLSLWLCCSRANLQHKLSFSPILCVAIAPIGNLEAAFLKRLGDEGDVIERFIGCTPNDDVGKLYDEACPSRLLPLTTNCLLISGENDVDVPSELVKDFFNAVECERSRDNHDMNNIHNNDDVITETYTSKEFVIDGNRKVMQYFDIPDADHYTLVDSNSAAWDTLSQMIKNICLKHV